MTKPDPFQGKRNRKGGKKGAAKPPLHLVQMRKVFQQEEEQDKLPAERVLRQVLNENPLKYIEQLTKAEFEFRRVASGPGAQAARGAEREGTSAAEPPAEEPVGQDAGSKRAKELIDRLLGESHAGKNAVPAG